MDREKCQPHSGLREELRNIFNSHKYENLYGNRVGYRTEDVMSDIEGLIYKRMEGEENKMRYLYKKKWEDFRKIGLLWWVNRTLHLFGWAICFDFEEDMKTIKEVYPARCKFRGFGNESESNGFKKLTKYLKQNADKLEKETLL